MIAAARPSRGMTRLLALVAVSVACAAGSTFFVPDILSGPDVMIGSARGTALVMLVLGVPLLLISHWLELRGWRWGQVVRIGVLAYLAYNGFMLLMATPFNRLFLVYVVAMSATVFALGASLLRADRELISERLPRTAARIVGGYILLIVVLNTLLWLRTIVPAILADVPTSYLDGMGIATNPVFVQDLVFWLPSAAIIGWLTLAQRPCGALLGGAYLVYGVVESIGVAVDQWLGSTADPASEIATMEGAYLFVVMAIIGAAALAFYARSARGSDTASAVLRRPTQA